MTWAEVCADRSLHDLPYKIETNRFGQIVMSPARINHGAYQSAIAGLLGQLLPDGVPITEMAIETPEGAKVPDVVWCSKPLFRKIQDQVSTSEAPEICVEVWSWSNTHEEMTEKRRLYFNAGAAECWMCMEHGQMAFFGPLGELDGSKLCPKFPRKIEL